MRVRFIVVLVCMCSFSAVVVAQAKVPHATRTERNIPDVTLASASGVGSAQANTPPGGTPQPNCAIQSSQSQLDLTSQVLQMILDPDSYQAFLQNEQPTDLQTRVERRLALIKSYIEAMKAHATN